MPSVGSNISWLSSISGLFTQASNWTPATVPGPADNAILNAAGPISYTVTSNSTQTVNSIQTAATGELSITGGVFTATNGTGSGANAGVISVGDNTTFAAGDPLDNSGSISLNSANNATRLLISAPSVSLSGGGHLTLSDNGANFILGASAGDVLTNVDNTISGAGQLGDGQLTLTNDAAGVIDASAANNALVLNTGGAAVTNAGLIEASGGGGLTIYTTTVNDAPGGEILAAGATVRLQTADIEGGTLNTSGGGAIVTIDRGSVVDGSSSIVDNQGALDILDNTSLTLEGLIDNTGAIALESGNNATQFIVGSANLTLSGGGQVTLSDDGANFIFGANASDVLTNSNNTISGAGQFGDGSLTLVNQASGVIDANAANNALVLNTGAVAVQNSGLIEATGAGGLTIYSTTVNDASGGVILAGGATVRLQTAEIVGGALETSGGGTIITTDRGSLLEATGSAVSNDGQLDIIDNTSLTAEGNLNNPGVIALESGNNATELIVGAANLTISGAGQVTLSDNGANYVIGTLSTVGGSQVVSTLTLDQPLSGAGQVGSNLQLVNNSTIDATGGNGLLIATGASSVAGSSIVTNNGLLESTNPSALGGPGGLLLTNITVSDSATALIEANGANTHVDLSGATIQGGTLETANGGVIRTLGRSSLVDSLTAGVTIQGQLSIIDNTTLNLQGTLNNLGTVALQSGNNATILQITTNNATLSGGGQVTLSDNGANYIYGATSAVVLTNANNTIVGAGQLGNGQLVFVNDAAGVVDASGGNPLYLNTGANVVTNHGLFEATGTGGLNIYVTTVDDSGGGELLASGSNITLTNADIIGGTLQSAAGGLFVTAGRSTLFDGLSSAVQLPGTVLIQDNTSLNIQGAIHDTSTIDVASGNNATELEITNANATLSGGGHVLLSDNGANYILGQSAASVLTNVDNLISGAGQLGDGQLVFINDAAGVVDATGGNALVLNTGANVVTNDGLIEATGTGGLNIYVTTVNDSAGGELLASGSTIALTNADIIGGTLQSTAGGQFLTVGRSTLLDGANFTVQLPGTVLIQDNTSLNIQGAIHDTSTIDVASGNNATELEITNANATLSGGGHVLLSDNGANYILGQSSASVLTNVDNLISGAGQLGDGQLVFINDAAGVVDATGGNALVLNTGANVVTNDGLIEATGSGGLNIYATTVNDSAGGVLLASGSNITLTDADLIGGSLQSALGGQFLTVGRGTLLDGTSATVNFGGALLIVDNTSLNIQGAIDNTGTITVGSGNNATELEITTANASLSGGGHVVLGDNAANYILGQAGTAVLTNVDNTISGAGQLGDGQLTLVNDAAGVIDATGGNALVLNTGAVAVSNAGLIEATASGGLTIQSAVNNASTGVIEANGGNVVVNGAVTGSGTAVVQSGSIDFTSSFAGAIHFIGATGLVELAQSQSYAGTVSGFSTSGGGTLDTLDLADISFTNPNQASFAGGVLTVSDGTHTAHIALAGNYTDTVFKTASDGHGGVDVTILAGAPISANDSYTDPVNQTLTVGAGGGVLANDVDPNGLSLTASVINGPAHGSLTLNANGSFTYAPNAGFTGTDSFTYQASDVNGASAPATVTLTVSANVPTLRPDAYSVGSGASLATNAANGVLANDTDPNGLTLSASLAPGSNVAHGVLTLNPDGSFTYTPNVGFVGADSFSYVAGDGVASGSPTLVTLTVSAGAPTSHPDTYSDIAGHTLNVATAAGVLANDTDPNGLTLSAALAPGGAPLHGTLSLNADGSFSYTPAAGYTGADSFSYIASDGVASGTPTTVTINITAGTPTANPDSYADAAGHSLTVGAAAGVLANDSDPNGLALSASLAPGGAPAHGTLSLGASGAFTYTPNLGFAGTDSFSYIAGDGAASSAPTTVTLTVTATAPTSTADAYSDAASHALTVAAASGVLANDTDANGLTLTAALAPGGAPAHGTLTLNPDGSFTYTPAAGFTGADSFSYIASDSLSSGVATTVNLTVSSGAPIAQADSYSGAAGHALTVSAAAGVLANDSDPNSLALSASLAPGGAPAHGTLSLNADGSFTYAPALGFAGTDSFSYIAGDGSASSAPTTVTLHIAATAPSSTADAYSDAAGHALTVAAASGVLANDTDANGLPLTAALAPGGGPAHGTLTLNPDGSFTYTPAAGFTGADSFSYIASDSLSSGVATAVNLTVSSGAPIAQADSYSGAAGHALTVSAAAGVLANDSDPNSLALSASLAPGGGPAHGTLSLNADGSFTYAPALGFAGTDSFSYIAGDGSASSAPTTVTLHIAAVAPSSTPDAYSDAAGQTLTIAAASGVLANDTDANGLPLTAALAPGGGPTHGTLLFNADGSFSYVPDAGYVGADSFSYLASDALSTGAPTIVDLSIGAGAPTSQPDSYSILAGQTLSIAAAAGVLANDTDPNGRALSAALAPGGAPAHGAVTLNADGSFTYTPNAGFVGADSFSYVASDGLASGTPTTVTVQVGAGAPSGNADAYAITAGHTLTVGASGVLANDIDPNGLSLTAALAGGGAPAHGSLTLNADGSFSYTPNAGFVGTDGFTYVASDGFASSSPVHVSLDITGAGVTGHASVYSVAAGASLSVGAPSGVLANDVDGSGLALSAALATGGAPLYGKVTLSASGAFVYTPTLHLGGVTEQIDSFTYVAKDSSGASVTETAVIISGSGNPVIGIGAGVETLTGPPGGNVYLLTKGEIENPALNGGLYDTVTNFSGVGAPSPSDYLVLEGFSKTATLAYEHDLAGEPNAHLYLITDGAYQAQIVLDFAGSGTALNHHDYGFY